MSTSPPVSTGVRVHVRNIGGIDETTVTFGDDVTVLAGQNATNRTSLLRALMAALGSTDTALKGDADEGEVRLAVDGEEYTRTLARRGDTVAFDGDPYLSDAEAADLFAFLLEDNEARRAVRRGEDLRDLIMRPVDTAAIRAEIDALTERRGRIDDELDELDRLKGRLPELESERSRLADRIAETETELAETESLIEEMDASVREASEEDDLLDEKLAELREVRSDLERVRADIDSEKRSLDALESERDELEAKREGIEEVPDGAESRIGSELDRLRRDEDRIRSTISELQTVVQYNEEMLEGTGSEVERALRAGEGRDDPTEQLVDGESVVCWTCGTVVDRDEIEDTLERLRSLRGEKRDELNETRERVDELESRRDELESRRDELERVDRELGRVERERDRRDARIGELESRREELEAEVGTLEERVTELEREDRSELLDRHREANELEFELGRLEDDLAEVETEIDGIEARLDDRSSLVDERETIAGDIEELRTRIDRIERRTVEEFNDHMAAVLELLEYDNLERIWIERLAGEADDGRFELHVVRTTDDGRAYEDTADHLSESEREVTGLVFALAGYLVHELHETMPFLLLDSLEAIDSERIALLVDYMADHADYLVTALLPEDDRAVDDTYERVTEI